MPQLDYFQNKLTIKPSRIKGAGLGLFAKCYIPKGTRLGWYRGDHLSSKEYLKTEPDTYIWMLEDDENNEFYVDAYKTKRKNKLRYANGCKTPGQLFSVNIEAYQKDDRIWYKTIRKIRPNEELIIDYGEEYWH